MDRMALHDGAGAAARILSSLSLERSTFIKSVAALTAGAIKHYNAPDTTTAIDALYSSIY